MVQMILFAKKTQRTSIWTPRWEEKGWSELGD